MLRRDMLIIGAKHKEEVKMTDKIKKNKYITEDEKYLDNSPLIILIIILL